MSKTCLDVITETGRFVGRPDAVYKERLRQFLNLSARAWTRQFPTPYSTRRTSIYATGAQQQGLPTDVDRPIYFLDKTNSYPISAGVEWDLNASEDFGRATSGKAYEWQFDGVYPLVAHPAGSYVTLESSASEARTVNLGGLVADPAGSGTGTAHYWQTETVYLTGTSAVTNATPFVEIHELARAERASPLVTVKKASTGGVLGHIAPNDLCDRHVWVRWLQVPTAGTEILMEYLPVIPQLAGDYQAIPAYIPYDFLYWDIVLQAAEDMERQSLVQIAARNRQEVIVNERQKQLGFGDFGSQATPKDDGWDYDGVS